MTDRNFKQENAEHLSQDAKNKVLAYLEIDTEYNAKLDAFLAAHPEEILALDTARSKRNRALDDAEQVMRRDADLAPKDKVTSITFGPFTAQKKEKTWFTPETFIAIANHTGLQQALIDSGIIQTVTTIDRDKADNFLKVNGAEKQFVAARASEAMTTAVTGPKEVPQFGMPLKKKS